MQPRLRRMQPTRAARLHRFAFIAALFGVAFYACGREVTAPSGNGVRYARGLSFNPVFPAAFQAAGAGTGLVAFTHVHIVLRHGDGTTALDTVVDFPAGSDAITLTLSVPLSASAPANGEQLSLDLDYINAAGVIVFHGGPVSVLATPTVVGQAPPPAITIPVT